jgi:hypothetical protein
MMINPKFSFTPNYSNSRAFIIGINRYLGASPLSFAVNDATEVATLLIDNFSFPKENVTVLLDENATKDCIMKSFLRYTNDDIDKDERIFVFFAGHGFTRTGIRGEIGYLVPYDADMSEFSTFIRWDDLTRNAELVPAKHMLFIMDACYGGLAINRSLKPGSVRFLKDMMIRYSRQVLTAGKADEVVSDAGGPLPKHSVFTGHLIEAITGKAANENGVITANAVMAYVYEKVASDKDSRDGDFIFQAPGLNGLSENKEKDNDELISIPFPSEPNRTISREDKVDTVKKLLSDENGSIELHDFVVEEIRTFLGHSAEDYFKIQGTFSQEDFLERISKYEELTIGISGITACVAYWAKPDHKRILQKIVARMTDRLDSQSGLVVWIYLRWYPIILQIYAAGIASVEGRRYDSLAEIFYSKIGSVEFDDRQETLVYSLGRAILELNRIKVFKQLPGHEQNYVPLSEYLFKLIQPILDDILFVGKGYEPSFDEFEVLLGLAVADARKQKDEGVWGPIGRFGWKYSNRRESPLTKIIETANREKEQWAPLKSGMFGGSFERFSVVADEYTKLIAGLNWF